MLGDVIRPQDERDEGFIDFELVPAKPSLELILENPASQEVDRID